MAGERMYIADKETLDKVYNMMAAEPIYGFIEHNAILAPGSRIEYTGACKGYTPLTVNKSTGAASLNSWAGFPWLLANKPYMVHSDGTPDYRLNENDYTKKEDGAASDVSNTAYDGGAFSWAQKIYKQEYMAGNDRVVNFSMKKRDGFEPVGFVDTDDNELEGVWIPMFYGSIVNEKMKCISGIQPCYSKTTAEEKTAIDKFGARAEFFGGPIVETLIDLLIMFAKTSNLQEAYGYGNSSGYDVSLTPTMGVKQNAVIRGGQFFGTSDGKSLNKIFHSIVLGSYQQWMRDPYEVVVNGRVKVSKDYTYDVTGDLYSDTGINVPDNKTWDANHNAAAYPSHYRTVPGYGSVPALGMDGGSSATGGCDGLWRKDPKQEFTGVALRFGNCSLGTWGGAGARLERVSWDCPRGHRRRHSTITTCRRTRLGGPGVRSNSPG